MDINDLLDDWQNMDTAEKRSEFLNKAKNEFRKLPKGEKDKFASDFFASAEKDVAIGEQLLSEMEMKKQLSQIVPFINISEVSRKYFHKSANWLHQRINGYQVNGKASKFSEEEKNILRYALNDISKIMQETSSKI